MNIPALFNSLLTFRKDTGTDLIVPRLDSTGRIRVTLLNEYLIVVSATSPSIIDGTALWLNTNDNNLYYYNLSNWIPLLSQTNHAELRDLIHYIDEGPAAVSLNNAYRETVGGAFPSSVIWWTSVAKTSKIVELTITRGSGQKPTTEEWKMYALDGSTVLLTVTDTFTYSGAFEASRTRTIV